MCEKAAQRHEELMAALSSETKELVNQPPTIEDFNQTKQAFDTADKNQDGLLNEEEYLAFTEIVMNNFE